MEGRVKTANSRGFGFIETQTGIDFYFHHTEWKSIPQMTWKQLLAKIVMKDTVVVEFDIDPTTTDGPRGVNVRLTEVMK